MDMLLSLHRLFNQRVFRGIQKLSQKVVVVREYTGDLSVRSPIQLFELVLHELERLVTIVAFTKYSARE